MSLADTATLESDGLPRIEVTGRQLREVTAETLAAIVQANTPPSVFVRTGRLAWLREVDGRPVLEMLQAVHVRSVMTRAANFFAAYGENVVPVFPHWMWPTIYECCRVIPSCLAWTGLPKARWYAQTGRSSISQGTMPRCV